MKTEDSSVTTERCLARPDLDLCVCGGGASYVGHSLVTVENGESACFLGLYLHH